MKINGWQCFLMSLSTAWVFYHTLLTAHWLFFYSPHSLWNSKTENSELAPLYSSIFISQSFFSLMVNSYSFFPWLQNYLIFFFLYLQIRGSSSCIVTSSESQNSLSWDRPWGHLVWLLVKTFSVVQLFLELDSKNKCLYLFEIKIIYNP